MAQNQKSYDNEFKAQAVKLAQEIGGHKAAQELGIPKGTMYTWIKAFKEGHLSANEAVHTPKNALSLNDELALAILSAIFFTNRSLSSRACVTNIFSLIKILP